MKKAVDLKVNALIVHHGLFWKNKVEPIDGAFYEKIKLLIQNNIALLAYHLPLDAHRTVGNNWKAARDLGWENLEPFGEYEGQFIGVRGTFKPMSEENFRRKLETYYGHPAASVEPKQTVASAALVSGGAHKQLHQAIAETVDCYVTGSYDLPAWSAAHENNINFYALGHSATEKVGVKALGEHLKTLGLDWKFIDSENPF